MEKVWRNLRGCAYYTYDENGNTTKKEVCSEGPLYHTYFTYDALNRPTEILNCLADGSPLAYFTYDYDDAGRMTKCVREDGNVVYYGYDDADRLTSEDWKDSGGSSIYAFTWDYGRTAGRSPSTNARRGIRQTS